MSGRSCGPAWVACTLVALVGCGPPHPTDPSASLTSLSSGGSEADETAARIEWIQRSLDAAQPSARLWHHGWAVVFSTIAAGSTVRAIAFNADNRAVGIVDSVASLLGLLSVVATPQPTMDAGNQLRRYRARTQDSPLRQLRHAEELLHEASESQAFTRGWLAQVGRVIVPSASALILQFAVRLSTPTAAAALAGMDLGLGLTIGQISGLTHPDDAVRAWRSYVREFPDAGRSDSPFGGHALSWQIVPVPGGVGVTAAF